MKHSTLIVSRPAASRNTKHFSSTYKRSMANQVLATLDAEQLIRELRAARGVDGVEDHHTLNIEDLEASVKL